MLQRAQAPQADCAKRSILETSGKLGAAQAFSCPSFTDLIQYCGPRACFFPAGTGALFNLPPPWMGRYKSVVTDCRTIER